MSEPLDSTPNAPSAPSTANAPNVRMSVWYATLILQGHPEVAKYCDYNGYVYFPTFKEIFEKTVCVNLSEEVVLRLKKTPTIEFLPGNDNYLRATFGHGGFVIVKMLRRTHTLYTGPQKVFCFSHTSMDGLGVINAGRKVSMLIPPQFCFNKGVRAYVDIDTLARNGISVWHQIGDRQTKVFCYSADLRALAFRVEYSADYFKEENLLRVHSKLIDMMRTIYPKMNDEEFKAFSTERIKRLVIHDEDDEDDELENVFENLTLSN